MVAACAMIAACGPGEWRPPAALDSHEDPMKMRPGFGNDALHTWWPLTEAEVAAVSGIERARQGDAHALLALAVFASADKRDGESYARYADRVDRFVEGVRKTMEGSADDWHRGDALNRAMHASFLTGAPDRKDPELGAYQLDQARLTRVFEEGHFNCISSALLYTILARAFTLSVRGVITTTHAFVEADAADKRVDVETTTSDGYGRVHDEHYYAEQAVKWSSSRGLKPMTFDDYKKRDIVPPYAFVARSMNDARISNSDTQGRLSEVAAMIEPDNADLAYNRMVAYVNEGKWLYDHKASRTMLRLVEVIAPVVSDIATKFASNAKVMPLVAWMAWYDAAALEIVGRGDEALSVADDALDRVDPSWSDAALLKNDLLGVLLDRMTELQTKGEYEKSLAAVAKRIPACLANAACQNNLYLTFDGWSARFQQANDYPGARKVLERCIALLPGDTRCRAALETIGSAK
jgi:hypothetical protein